MKKISGKAKLFLMVGAILLSLPAMAQAIPWQYGDSLTIGIVGGYSVPSGIGGYGGLFEITNTTRGETVYGFCVELDEWTSAATKVDKADDDNVRNGGRNPESPDELSGATQWLYWKYLTDSDYQTAQAVKALQLAIWYLEGEYDGIALTPDDWENFYKNIDPTLASEAHSYIVTANNHNNFQSDQILALNTWNEQASGQSFIYKIPESTTITMLGLGLLGFAIGARRMARKRQ